MPNDSPDRLSGLLNYQGKDRLVSWQEYLKNQGANQGSALKIETGFPELDAYLDCLVSGEVVVLSGLTGNGKTLLAKGFIRNMAAQNVPCMVLSFEVSTAEFLKAFKTNNLPHAFYVPMELKSGFIPWVEDRVIEGCAKFMNKVVLIDHLHYVVDMKMDKMSLNIGAAMRRLKEIAIKYGQIIFVVAHQEKLKDDKEPGIETLRDSSFIGQESDVVIIVHRIPDPTDGKEKNYDGGYALVKIEKARRSGVFKKRLTFIKKGDWLEPL